MIMWLLTLIENIMARLYPNKPLQPVITHSQPMPPVMSTPTQSTPQQAPVPAPAMLFDTPKHAWHSVRVLCDNAGLSLDEKNLICSVIMGESEFSNKAKNQNFRKDGTIGSTDWGICQINDRFHIGPKLDFPSVQFVLDNPDKAVQFMITMYKAGQIGLWCAYSGGRYAQFLLKSSPMWKLAVV